jgi:hypothetical protein
VMARLREIALATKAEPVSPCRITAANQAQIAGAGR